MKWKWEARYLIHGTMLAFAGASLGNVREFFSIAGHPPAAAWPMAIALSSALVTLSILITEIDREADGGAFAWLLMTALLLGTISGSLQMHVYQQHLPWPWPALLGYGIPLGGEVCLAQAASSYAKARRRERYRNISLTVETAVADRLESAVERMDPETIRRHVERTINSLARYAVDSVAARALSYYQPNAASTLESEWGSGEAAQFGPHNLPKAQSIRVERLAAQTEERAAAILHYLAGRGPQTTKAVADAVSIHRDTARKYLSELAASGQLESTGDHRWRLAPPINSRS